MRLLSSAIQIVFMVAGAEVILWLAERSRQRQTAVVQARKMRAICRRAVLLCCVLDPDEKLRREMLGVLLEAVA